MNSALKNIPILETLVSYKRENLRFDFIAALTVAVVALPQSMAYAIIAGVDPVYGLYSAIVLSILGSAFGSSHHLATGPTNAISLLVASYMSSFLGQQNFYQTLFLLTFLVGAIQFLMGTLKLGKLVNYVSHSVVVGFTAGAGVIIALGQLNQLLGISLPKGKFSTLEKVMMTFEHIDQLNYYALGLGLFTIAVILVAKKINKNIPGALLGIVLSVILVMVAALAQYGIKLTGDIPSAIPPFAMIGFDPEAMRTLFSGAMVIAIIGLVEAVSISKAISAQTLQKVDSNQEFIGQGVANIGGAFFGSIAGSGSFTRSAIAYQSGARTRLSGVLAGLIVLVVLMLFSPYAKYIPNASLAGVIMVVAYSMVDKKAVARVFKSNPNDGIVLSVTFLTTILAPELEYAIYAGIAISVILFLRDTGTATVRLLVPGEDGLGRFVEYNLHDVPRVKDDTPVSVIQLEGKLYFGSAADLEHKLDCAYTDSKVFVLRFNNVTDMDISSIEIVENFISRADREGKKVLFSGVRPEIRKRIEKCNLISHMGPENIFPAEREIFSSSRQTLQAAYHYIRDGAMPAGCGLLAEKACAAQAHSFEPAAAAGKWSLPTGRQKLAGATQRFAAYVENFGLSVIEREIDLYTWKNAV
jgi:SulP family sulfate permease